MNPLRLLGPRAADLRRFVAYGLASVVALGIDVAFFLAFMAAGLAPAMAAAAGYATGILAHWALSTRFVFSDRVAAEGPALRHQRALFVLSALVGLALNYGIVKTGDGAGFDPRIAKLVAIGVGFFVTWFIREKLVFVVRGRAAA